jgi:hypothetical protein
VQRRGAAWNGTSPWSGCAERHHPHATPASPSGGTDMIEDELPVRFESQDHHENRWAGLVTSSLLLLEDTASRNLRGNGAIRPGLPERLDRRLHRLHRPTPDRGGARPSGTRGMACRTVDLRRLPWTARIFPPPHWNARRDPR